MDQVADIMTKDVQTSTENEAILNIAKMMYARRIGSVVVVRSNKPIGIITERDLTYKVVANNIQPLQLVLSFVNILKERKSIQPSIIYFCRKLL